MYKIIYQCSDTGCNNYYAAWKKNMYQQLKLVLYCLMFVLCILDVAEMTKNMHWLYTSSLFYILAPTRFSSRMPSSGSFLDPSELCEIQIEYVVCHINVLVLPSAAGKHNRRNHENPAHRLHNHTLYDTPPIPFVTQVTQKDLRSSLMMADYCWNM
jgi:hypothetical protein